MYNNIKLILKYSPYDVELDGFIEIVGSNTKLPSVFLTQPKINEKMKEKINI